MIRQKPVSAWTDARVELLKQSYADGLSASAIARQLGGAFTRNAVIGKLSRLGLTGDGTRPTKERTAKPRMPRSADRTVGLRRRHAPLIQAADLEAPEFIGPIGESAPRNTCQWIAGDPVNEPDWRMCGHPGSPWCAHHRRAAHQRQQTAAAADMERSLEASASYGGRGIRFK